MQRAVGNRAVSAALASARGGQPRLQRMPGYQRFADQDHPTIGAEWMPVKAAVADFIQGLNSRVEEAAALVRSLAFMRFGSSEGYMWKFEDLALRRARGETQPQEWNTAARKAGYWIEQYATYFKMPPKPLPSPGELGWAYQIASGRTRPDIELYWNFGEGPVRVGWVDITSTGQDKHILTKSSSLWSSDALYYVGEMLYQSIDFLALGNAIDGLRGDLDALPQTAADIAARIRTYEQGRRDARAAAEEWLGLWSALGSVMISDREVTRARRKEVMRWAMYYVLFPDAGEDDQPGWAPLDAAAVLLAAGIPPARYEWPSTTGRTAQDGWLWLQAHNITRAPERSDNELGDALRRAKRRLGIRRREPATPLAAPGTHTPRLKQPPRPRELKQAKLNEVKAKQGRARREQFRANRWDEDAMDVPLEAQ